MHTINKLKYMMLGAIITLMLMVATKTNAALTAKTIQVFSGVTIYVNDALYVPRDANGNIVEAFIYEGTTYLPARAISDAVGRQIRWDGETQSVFIGYSAPVLLFKDAQHLVVSSENDSMRVAVREMDNRNTYHYDVVTGRIGRTLRIGGQYNRMKGIFYLTQARGDASNISRIEIFGDDRLLYSAALNSGADPIPFEVDVSGINNLRVLHYTEDGPNLDTYSSISSFGFYS